MQESLLALLRCPVTRSKLELRVLTRTTKQLGDDVVEVVEDGILFADADWFYPVIKGVPRLLVEAFLDYESFLRQHLPDYTTRREQLEHQYGGLIRHVVRKNTHTKKSFSQEWSIFNYETDKVWHLDEAELLQTFLNETAETKESVAGKLLFDAGCGNGLLDQYIAQLGATVLAMDFSLGIERAYEKNKEARAFFIQGDVQFPPVLFEQFDIVHSSGVLIHTNNTELSFSCIDPCVKIGGKLSVWLYHPRKDLVHNLFNFIRRYSSRLPLRFQYYLYSVTLLPVSYIVKRLKGNKQSVREMMLDILDWFTPQFRWEHEQAEVAVWFSKRRYANVRATTVNLFGYNMTGVKNK